MRGWIRLWIVFSIIWSIACASFLYVTLPTDSEGPWIKYKMAEQHRKHYEVIAEGSPLYFSVSIKNIDVRFKLSDFEEEPTKAVLQEKLPMALEKHSNQSINPFELELFYRDVKDLWSEAKSAKESYSAILKSQQQNRQDHLLQGLLVIVSIPLATLLFGFSVAWVRAGFEKSTT